MLDIWFWKILYIAVVLKCKGSRVCGSCPPGYFGDGITCSYRGVCQINNGGCHPLARCLDNASMY